MEYTRQVIYVEDNEIAELSPKDLHFSTINAVPLQKNVSTLEMRLEEIELSGYSHHMIKEINEQPVSLRNTLRGRLSEDNSKIKLGGLSEHESYLANHQRILITGCGTAWHASLVGEYLFDESLSLIEHSNWIHGNLRFHSLVKTHQTPKRFRRCRQLSRYLYLHFSLRLSLL